MAIWHETFTVRSFDVDGRGILTPLALLAWMLEAAGRHAVALGWGIHQLHQRGMTWMLSRLRLAVASLPSWGETVSLRTWPSGIDRLFALRELELLGGDGRVLAHATSAWLLLDLGTRRPLRPGPELAALAEVTPGPREHGAAEALPELAAASGASTFLARAFDLDINGHVTAATLARWVLESLPAPTLMGSRLQSLDLDFRAEVMLGDEVVGEYENRGSFHLHRLRRTGDGREVLRGRTSLAPV